MPSTSLERDDLGFAVKLHSHVVHRRLLIGRLLLPQLKLQRRKERPHVQGFGGRDRVDDHAVVVTTEEIVVVEHKLLYVRRVPMTTAVKAGFMPN